MSFLKRILLVLNGANFLLFFLGATLSFNLVISSVERFYIEPEDFFGGSLLVFLCLFALAASSMNVLCFFGGLSKKNRMLLSVNVLFVIMFSLLGLSGVLQLVGSQSRELIISLIPAMIFFLSLCFFWKDRD